MSKRKITQTKKEQRKEVISFLREKVLELERQGDMRAQQKPKRSAFLAAVNRAPRKVNSPPDTLASPTSNIIYL